MRCDEVEAPNLSALGNSADLLQSVSSYSMGRCLTTYCGHSGRVSSRTVSSEVKGVLPVSPKVRQTRASNYCKKQGPRLCPETPVKVGPDHDAKLAAVPHSQHGFYGVEFSVPRARLLRACAAQASASHTILSSFHSPVYYSSPCTLPVCISRLVPSYCHSLLA